MAKKKSSKKRKSPAANSAPAIPSAAEQQRWQAENDLSMLRQAEEVKSDSGRLRRAQKLADEQAKALKKVSKIKKRK